MMKNIRNIKAKPYTTVEVAKLCGVHKRTVHEWLKCGLKLADDKRPYLIHGSDLKVFLLTRSQERKTKLSEGEFYCVKCKKGVIPVNLSIEKKNEKQISVKGFCPNCKSKVNYFDSLENAHKWEVKSSKQEIKAQTTEMVSPKKRKKKKETEQIRLWDDLDDSINNNLGDVK